MMNSTELVHYYVVFRDLSNAEMAKLVEGSLRT